MPDIDLDQYTGGMTAAEVGSALAGFGGSLHVRLPRLRQALANSISGGEPARILLLGDSTFAGSGAGGSGYPADTRQHSTPEQLRRVLESVGCRADAQSIIENQNVPDIYSWDTRFTNGSGWNLSLLNNSYTYVWGNTTTTNALRFHPDGDVDTFRVWYVAGTDGREFSVDVNSSGSPTTVAAGSHGAWEMASVDISATLGDNYIDVSRVSGNIYIIGFEAFDSSKDFNVIQMGGGGNRVSDCIGTGSDWSSLSSVVRLDADVVVINLVINEWLSEGDVPTFKTDLTTIIDALQAAGSDIICLTGVPTGTAVAALSTQQTYIDAVKEVCESEAVICIDTHARFGTKEGVPASWYTDSTHPTKVGYADFMRSLTFLGRV